MVISQPPGNNPSYYYRASLTLPQLLGMLPETPMFYTCNYNIRVTHRNGAIKHILHESDPRSGSSADCSLFILSLHALALHLAVKYYFKSSVWRFEHAGLHTSVGCIRNASRICIIMQPILLSETFLIFDNHQQIRRSDQIETIKTAIIKTTRPYLWKVLPMAQVAIFKEISTGEKDLDCELFYSELKRHNVSHYIYLSSHR